MSTAQQYQEIKNTKVTQFSLILFGLHSVITALSGYSLRLVHSL